MLAFVVNQFPRQVDAYFLRELSGSRRAVSTSRSTRCCRRRAVGVHADARAAARARRSTRRRPARVARAALAARRARTRGRLAASAAQIAWGHRSMPQSLAKSLAIVPQSLAFARDMRARGVAPHPRQLGDVPGRAAALASRA